MSLINIIQGLQDAKSDGVMDKHRACNAALDVAIAIINFESHGMVLVPAEQLKEREWISVDDELPKPEKNVLVFSPQYGFQIDMMERIVSGYKFNIDRSANYPVTHWQKLPEVPHG